ncbi:hypothetical protein [Marinifilum flexuosum]|uniref:Dolichyl-phosphate-mannose-protein mannosyltransferase n=1 Tax=Marinifilum flexuosum TaxID=1117708 RepID=A0A419X984_9BACT|nr:hypothetical protein [Marinifilum flexuosum]RKE04337.1 hypothetical protein BXY64_1357 [Marinifilum flexuosum]
MNKEAKITGVFLCMIAVFVVAAMWYPWMGSDSGYYLKIAYDLSKGISFFKDIGCGYTPMGMYVYSLPFLIYPQMEGSLLFLYLLFIYVVSVFLFYKIIGCLGVDKPMRVLYSILLLLALFTQQGTHFLLEPIVLVFQLAAIWFALVGVKHNRALLFFFSGFAVFLAFYSKQYALFIVPGILVLISIHINSVRKMVYRLILVGTGFFLPLLVILSFQHFVNELSIIDILKRFAGIDYIIGNGKITGVDYSFKKFIASISLFLLQFPFVFLPFFLKTSRSDWKDKKIIAFSLLAICSFLQLYFAAYRHYYQLIVPYVLMLFILLIAKKYNQGHCNVRKIAIYLAIFFILPASIQLIRECSKRPKRYVIQNKERQIFDDANLTYSKVYLQGISPAYYFLCKFDSPNLRYLGYKFPEELSLEDIDNHLSDSSYVIGNTEFLTNKSFAHKYLVIKTFLDKKERKIYVLKKNSEK